VATDLLEKPPLLDDICDRFLPDAAVLVDILEGIEVLRLLVLNDPDLGAAWTE
jgi:hypothetical protein